MQSYLLLGISIVFELLGTSFMKMSDGYSRLFPTVGVFICLRYCFLCFGNYYEYVAVKCNLCDLVGCWFGSNGHYCRQRFRGDDECI